MGSRGISSGADRIHVTRRFHALVGLPKVGGAVRPGVRSRSAAIRDVLRASRTGDIGIHTHLGDMPAWFVPGPRTTWVVMDPTA